MPPTVLLVEDDARLLHRYARDLDDTSDLRVLTARTIGEAVGHARAGTGLAAAVVDLKLAATPATRREVGAADSQDDDGLVLGRWLRQHQPGLPVLGLSAEVPPRESECAVWFRQHGDPSGDIGVYDKQTQRALLRHHVFRLTGQPSPVTVFLVHGHDPDGLLDDARGYAQTVLGWTTRVLSDEARHGSTWIEMLEGQAHHASLAWVLGTPDEWGCPLDPRRDSPQLRPRPNVLLEYGFFLGRFGRLSRRVFQFRRPGVSLGSDLRDVASIEVPGRFADQNRIICETLRPWLLPNLAGPTPPPGSAAGGTADPGRLVGDGAP